MLFKGFSILTNLGYESSVPERAEEMVISVIAQNVKVIIDAYILGTLFHYIVKQDPQLEALRGLMTALSNYCTQRSLGVDLQRRMADYLRFQQKHTGSHLQLSLSVRHFLLSTRTVHDANSVTQGTSTLDQFACVVAS